MPRKKNPDIRENRQQQILAAARTVFAQQGFADARMDDIAAISGLSKGSLYLYYKSKDDLVSALLEVTFDETLIHLRTLLDLDTSIRQRLLDHTRQIAGIMGQDASSLNIAYEFYATAARQPALRQFLKAYFAEYQRVLVDLFDQGIARGEFKPFDTAQAALTLIALLEGLTLVWFTDPDSVPLDTVLPQMIDHFMNGLG